LGESANYQKGYLVCITAVFISVDYSRDVVFKLPTRFWLWRCSSSIWKVL